MALRVFHTSDWHLGKKLYKVSRIPEQNFFLDWLIDQIKAQNVDALIIAGDIFDSPLPPTEALKLYFSFLNRLIKETNCNAYIIAGNHDSGKFLEAPESILPSERIQLIGQIKKDLQVKIYDRDNNFANFLLLPYFRSHEVINLAKSHWPDLCDLESSELILEVLKRLIQIPKEDKSLANILIGHHVFGDFFPAGSEQSLSLSGLDSIPLGIFDELFDYLALGHIHKPQHLGHNAYYSGSPIPFRFSETQQKSLLQLDINTEGSVVNKLPIPQARIFATINCDENDYASAIQKFMTNISSDYPLHPLLEVKLKLNSPQNKIVDHIREIISTSDIELLAVHTILPNNDVSKADIKIYETPDLTTLFDKYYQIKNPDSPNIPPQIQEAFHQLLDEINGQEDE